MRISTIYPTYQGETNVFGIGAPVIFIRTAGCHLRCYKSTLGILCDTPKELDANSGSQMTVTEIVEEVEKISSDNGGIKLICFTGGDPLWRSQDEIHDLLAALGELKYHVSIETSGTLSVREFSDYKFVSFVIDYKLKSAGIKQKFMASDLPLLGQHDIIKFVVYDLDDYNEFVGLFKAVYETTIAKISIGVYWGSTSTMKVHTLVDLLKADKIFGKVNINMQAHKLLTMYDSLGDETFKAIKIPEKL